MGAALLFAHDIAGSLDCLPFGEMYFLFGAGFDKMLRSIDPIQV